MRTAFVLFLLCCSTPVIAQNYTAQECIGAWNDHTRTQTLNAYRTYRDLEINRNADQYRKLKSEIDQAVKRRRSTRLAIRAFMYHAFYEMLSSNTKTFSRDDFVTLKTLMVEAHRLEDAQLLSELYGLYGENCSRINNIEEALFYNIKAAELQQSIGMEYFPNRNELYLSTAVALYKTKDYKQSLRYSLRCNYANIPEADKPEHAAIFLNNIIGGAYEQLQRLDTALYYYKQNLPLLSVVQKDTAWQQFWIALTNADIARIHFLRNDAYPYAPYLDTAIHRSLSFGATNNAAAFLNTRAAMAFKAGEPDRATRLWKQALHLATDSLAFETAAEASRQLAAVYKNLSNADSVYHYLLQYNKYQDAYNRLITNSRLSAARVKLDFEQLQNNYLHSLQTVARQKRIRNSIILAIIILGFIVWLLYTRRMQRHTYTATLNENKRLLAEQKVAAAQVHIEQFKKSIIEKDQLISALKAPAGDPLPMDETYRRLQEQTILTEEDWSRFKKEFEIIHPHFFTLLRHRIPGISPAMLRLCALIHLKFDNMQIAGCLGISESSVTRSKRRLRIKLQLDDTRGIEEFLENL